MDTNANNNRESFEDQQVIFVDTHLIQKAVEGLQRAREEFQTLLEQAEGGDASVYYDLGVRYTEGDGTDKDPAQAAQRCVSRLEEQGAEFIICLSHSGTSQTSASEDEDLARAVPEIDLIVSGHTHTTLPEPIVVGDTYIVSAGSNCENLGSITLSWNGAGEKTLEEYRLIPIDGTAGEDPEISALARDWKEQVEIPEIEPNMDKMMIVSGEKKYE